MRFVFMIGFLASGASAQEFTLPTPKGDVVVKIAQKTFELGSFFRMKGTITNTTTWDFKYLTMRVAFSDSSGREMTELCRPVDIYCDTLSVDIPAGKTISWDSSPAIVFNSTATNFRAPNASTYKLLLKEAKYHVKRTFSLVKPKPSDILSFEDESVSATFLIDPDGISCNLRNKTGDPVTINWNNVSWVDYSGEAHKLIHSGVRLMDKEAPQPPTVIPPLARITETMFPADHVRSTSSGWSKDSMWPDLVELFQDHSALKKLEGATFSLFMPLDVQGKTRNYNFIFTTKSVEF